MSGDASGHRRRDARWRYGVPVGLMVAMTFVSSGPQPVALPGQSDKLAHAAAFAVLAASWVFALLPRRRPSWRLGLLAVGLATAWGALDELHQSFVPERTASIGDVIADGAGAALGATLAVLAARAASRSAGESSRTRR